MKKFVYVLTAILALFIVSCQKKAPTNPVSDNTPVVLTATVTMTSTPADTSTVTFTATITETYTSTATQTITETSTITPTSTATMTVTCTNTPLETATALIPGANYAFSAAAEMSNWQVFGGNSLVYTSAEYYDPPGSMTSVVDNGCEVFLCYFSTGINVTGKVMSFYIKCPMALAGYEIGIGMTSYGMDEHWQNLGFADGSGQWQHFVWDTLANPPPLNMQMTLENIWIFARNGSLPVVTGGNIYVDSVDFDY